jgi:outer membrane protein OmpA-like peptidoglycan-associated protein
MPGIDPTIRNTNRNTFATQDDALGVETHEAGAGKPGGDAKAGADNKKPPLTKPKDRIDYGDVGRPSYLDLVRRPPKQGDINKRTINVGPLETAPRRSNEEEAPLSTPKRAGSRGPGSDRVPERGVAEEAQKPALSKAEQAERRRVARLSDGIGFAHGSARLDKSAARRWLKSLSRGQRDVLRGSGGQITLIGGASGTGTPTINKRLAEQRAKAVASFLKQELGARCEIRVELRCESVTGKDNAKARSVQIRIDTTPEEATRRFMEGKPRACKGAAGKRGAAAARDLVRSGGAARRIKGEEGKAARKSEVVVPHTLIKMGAEVFGVSGIKTLLDGLSAMGKASVSAHRYGKNANLADGWASVIGCALKHPNASEAQLRKMHGNAGKPPLLPRGRGYDKRDHDKQGELRRAYESGCAIALKLVAKMKPADRKRLAAAIDAKAHGDNRQERVRNFGRWLTGSLRSRNPIGFGLAQRALAGQLF